MLWAEACTEKILGFGFGGTLILGLLFMHFRLFLTGTDSLRGVFEPGKPLYIGLCPYGCVAVGVFQAEVTIRTSKTYDTIGKFYCNLQLKRNGVCSII